METTLGQRGEQLATWYLRLKGYRIIARNYRIRGGEIDIICRRGGCVVFVEVKTRSGQAGGYPEEYVTPAKLQKIQRTIAYYLLEKRRPPKAIRIDVISITFGPSVLPEVLHLQNIEQEK